MTVTTTAVEGTPLAQQLGDNQGSETSSYTPGPPLYLFYPTEYYEQYPYAYYYPNYTEEDLIESYAYNLIDSAHCHTKSAQYFPDYSEDFWNIQLRNPPSVSHAILLYLLQVDTRPDTLF